MLGKEEAETAAAKLLSHLREKPGGYFKARVMERMIKVHRSLIGAREYPKYFIVRNLAIIKEAILREASDWLQPEFLNNRKMHFGFPWKSLRRSLRPGSWTRLWSPSAGKNSGGMRR